MRKVEGETIARAVGREPDDTEVYYVLGEADRRGDLASVAWRRRMGFRRLFACPGASHPRVLS